MVTETEYCLLQDLATARAALAVLRNIAPECGHNEIKKDEWMTMMQMLIQWEDRINSKLDQ